MKTTNETPILPVDSPVAMPRVALTTLGCKVNMYDTQAVAGLFRDRGYTVVDFGDIADICVINTCTVTNMGARKSRQMIRRAVRHNPQAIVVVMGCYAQSAPDEVLAIDGVDVVLGTQPRAQVVDLAEEAAKTGRRINAVGKIASIREYEELEATHSEGRTRAILKVQDGCTEYCAYCEIPRVRGRSRSRLPEHVVEQARELVGQGFQEVILTGVHLGAYGKDLAEPTDLAALVRAVAAVPGIMRVRISSVDPHEVSDGLIQVIAENRNVCRHLHIPAQSGEDTVLRAMRRRNTALEYRELVERLRGAIPTIAVTTDIIVGFPGESEASFATTYAFCSEIEFSKVHVFPYSRRQGTRAASLPDHVSEAIKRERAHRLMELSDSLALSYHESLLNTRVKVLLEGPSNEFARFVQGLADTYARVHIPDRGGNASGQLVTAIPCEAYVHGLVGKWADEH